jgi:hypothetical protein
MAQRVAQVDDERFEVIAEASSRRGEAGALELCDQGPEPLPCVALVLGLVERLPAPVVGPALIPSQASNSSSTAR